jgi:hypothetical protein
MSKKKHIYGAPLTALYSIFSNLRLEYKEIVASPSISPHIFIKEFNIKIYLVRKNIELTKVVDSSKLEFYYSLEWGGMETQEFANNLMFTLIDCGYMAYIRYHPLGANGRIYQSLLVKHNWARRIINKRLEEWAKRPDRQYLHKYTKEITTMFSTLEIVDRYPGFFDFLY